MERERERDRERDREIEREREREGEREEKKGGGTLIFGNTVCIKQGSGTYCMGALCILFVFFFLEGSEKNSHPPPIIPYLFYSKHQNIRDSNGSFCSMQQCAF